MFEGLSSCYSGFVCCSYYLCQPLVGQPISTCIEQYSHLVGLELADFANEGCSLQVDVLIGSHYYWDLVTGSMS